MEINNVKILPLKKIEDERGAVMHMLRADQEHFQGFGEIYFSLVKPGVIKGWKLHKRISQSMSVPEGKIRMVVYDSRKESTTFGQFQIINFGNDHYALVQLPPNVWYAFQATSEGHAIIANCITAPHEPGESETLDLKSAIIPFDWSANIFM
jgi:dTDP-4-dehydrorhamnose 3,5-epimerase